MGESVLLLVLVVVMVGLGIFVLGIFVVCCWLVGCLCCNEVVLLVLYVWRVLAGGWRSEGSLGLLGGWLLKCVLPVVVYMYVHFSEGKVKKEWHNHYYCTGK